MKTILLLLLISLLGCTSSKIYKQQTNLTRTYIGSYISYTYRAPEKWTEPHLCWIKTTQGDIPVFAKEIGYREGEWLYISRVPSPIPGSFGSIIVKQIESSDSGYYYRLYN